MGVTNYLLTGMILQVVNSRDFFRVDSRILFTALWVDQKLEIYVLKKTSFIPPVVKIICLKGAVFNGILMGIVWEYYGKLTIRGSHYWGSLEFPLMFVS